MGRVREINEDCILSSPEVQLWTVADGIGGYEAGNVASNMIVKALDGITTKPSLSGIVDSVEDSLIDVNRRIIEYADIMLDGRTLGSTVVILLIKGRVGICLWAGDSRLYRYRNRHLLQLSYDHSQVEEQVKQGHLTREQAINHPHAHVITRAVGADPDLMIDINLFSVQLGDIFLLCSDGLYNMLTEDEITHAIYTLPFDGVVESLIHKALDYEADDNVSIILVKGVPGKKLVLPTTLA